MDKIIQHGEDITAVIKEVWRRESPRLLRSASSSPHNSPKSDSLEECDCEEYDVIDDNPHQTQVEENKLLKADLKIEMVTGPLESRREVMNCSVVEEEENDFGVATAASIVTVGEPGESDGTCASSPRSVPSLPYSPKKSDQVEDSSPHIQDAITRPKDMQTTIEDTDHMLTASESIKTLLEANQKEIKDLSADNFNGIKMILEQLKESCKNSRRKSGVKLLVNTTSGDVCEHTMEGVAHQGTDGTLSNDNSLKRLILSEQRKINESSREASKNINLLINQVKQTNEYLMQHFNDSITQACDAIVTKFDGVNNFQTSNCDKLAQSLDEVRQIISEQDDLKSAILEEQRKLTESSLENAEQIQLVLDSIGSSSSTLYSQFEEYLITLQSDLKTTLSELSQEQRESTGRLNHSLGSINHSLASDDQLKKQILSEQEDIREKCDGIYNAVSEFSKQMDKGNEHLVEKFEDTLNGAYKEITSVANNQDNNPNVGPLVDAINQVLTKEEDLKVTIMSHQEKTDEQHNEVTSVLQVIQEKIKKTGDDVLKQCQEAINANCQTICRDIGELKEQQNENISGVNDAIMNLNDNVENEKFQRDQYVGGTDGEMRDELANILNGKIQQLDEKLSKHIQETMQAQFNDITENLNAMNLAQRDNDIAFLNTLSTIKTAVMNDAPSKQQLLAGQQKLYDKNHEYYRNIQLLIGDQKENNDVMLQQIHEASTSSGRLVVTHLSEMKEAQKENGVEFCRALAGIRDVLEHGDVLKRQILSGQKNLTDVQHENCNDMKEVIEDLRNTNASLTCELRDMRERLNEKNNSNFVDLDEKLGNVLDKKLGPLFSNGFMEYCDLLTKSKKVGENKEESVEILMKQMQLSNETLVKEFKDSISDACFFITDHFNEMQKSLIESQNVEEGDQKDMRCNEKSLLHTEIKVANDELVNRVQETVRDACQNLIEKTRLDIKKHNNFNEVQEENGPTNPMNGHHYNEDEDLHENGFNGHLMNENIYNNDDHKQIREEEKRLHEENYQNIQNMIKDMRDGFMDQLREIKEFTIQDYPPTPDSISEEVSDFSDTLLSPIRQDIRDYNTYNREDLLTFTKEMKECNEQLLIKFQHSLKNACLEIVADLRNGKEEIGSSIKELLSDEEALKNVLSDTHDDGEQRKDKSFKNMKMLITEIINVQESITNVCHDINRTLNKINQAVPTPDTDPPKCPSCNNIESLVKEMKSSNKTLLGFFQDPEVLKKLRLYEKKDDKESPKDIKIYNDDSIKPMLVTKFRKGLQSLYDEVDEEIISHGERHQRRQQLTNDDRNNEQMKEEGSTPNTLHCVIGKMFSDINETAKEQLINDITVLDEHSSPYRPKMVDPHSAPLHGNDCFNDKIADKIQVAIDDKTNKLSTSPSSNTAPTIQQMEPTKIFVPKTNTDATQTAEMLEIIYERDSDANGIKKELENHQMIDDGNLISVGKEIIVEMTGDNVDDMSSCDERSVEVGKTSINRNKLFDDWDVTMEQLKSKARHLEF